MKSTGLLKIDVFYECSFYHFFRTLLCQNIAHNRSIRMCPHVYNDLIVLLSVISFVVYRVLPILFRLRLNFSLDSFFALFDLLSALVPRPWFRSPSNCLPELLLILLQQLLLFRINKRTKNVPQQQQRKKTSVVENRGVERTANATEIKEHTSTEIIYNTRKLFNSFASMRSNEMI